MSPPEHLSVGREFTFSRVFTNKDVADFAAISGDFGRHHVVPDADDRLIVHGLLVVALATKIGAEIHYLAHRMDWLFVRPVYTGEVVGASVEIVSSTPQEDRVAIGLRVTIRNAAGKIAVRGESQGVVLKAVQTGV